MTVPDLRGLIQRLVEYEVEFVIVGGIAVAAHGYIRATEDVDIVPAPDPENVDRLLTAIRSASGTLPLQGGRPVGDPDRPALDRGEGLSTQTDLGDLDVLGQLRGVPDYATLATDAIAAELFGIPVRVCSLDHLRAMKRERGSHQDLADLEGLEQAS